MITEVTSNPKDLRGVISKYRPDWCIVCGWYYIIPESVLNMVKYGFAGIHASLLPKFRGSSPLVWAMIAGERTVGASFFKFGPGVDDGPAFFQCECTVESSDTICNVLTKVENATLACLTNTYRLILDNKITPLAQSEEGVSYCAPRKPEDGRIDWTKSASEVHDFVRAQSAPYPGAFTYRGNDLVVICRAEPARVPHFAQPGQLARRDGKAIYIGCGNRTALNLLEICVNGHLEIPSQLLRTYQERLS